MEGENNNTPTIITDNKYTITFRRIPLKRTKDWSRIDQAKNLLWGNKAETATTEEKKHLAQLLKDDNQKLKKHYLAKRTPSETDVEAMWSEEDLDLYNNRKLLIGVLKPEIIIKY
jgi:hypothetical protein